MKTSASYIVRWLPTELNPFLAIRFLLKKGKLTRACYSGGCTSKYLPSIRINGSVSDGYGGKDCDSANERVQSSVQRTLFPGLVYL